MGFLRAILPSPALADLLEAYGRFWTPVAWKFAKSFRSGGYAVPVKWHQQPVLISGRLGSVFRAGRVLL